jgi:hypothetical protein
MSIHISGAHHKPETCSEKIMENTASNNCCTARECECGFKQTPTCDIEDCELESSQSSSASLSTRPSHEKTEQVSKAGTGQ